MRMTLKITVHGTAAHGFVKIHFEAVEVRAVHAGKFCLSADTQAAAAAHPGSVDHDWIHGYSGFTPKGFVVATTNFIIISGPMAITSSYPSPASIAAFSGAVTTPFSP